MKSVKTIFYLVCIFFCNCAYAQIINTIAGIGSIGYTGDGGAALSATFHYPSGIVVDTSLNIYTVDRANNCVRKINSRTGFISTIAGTGVSGFSGDGGAATAAQMYIPRHIAIDKFGNLYICESGNMIVRKVNTSGIITTFAGTPGISSTSGDGGPATAAQFSDVMGIAIDTTGNVFVSDYFWNVRRIDAVTGVITTFAGSVSAGYSGDGGPATAAMLNFPAGLATDRMGNVYICDRGNNRIRKVDAAGIITTIAGNGTTGSGGDGGPATSAQFNAPFAMCKDVAGNLYISDCYNNKVRKIDASGIISTVAGTGVGSFAGDGGPATAALINRPVGICAVGSGTLYFCDELNQRVRVITPPNHAPYFTGGRTQILNVCSEFVTTDTLLAVVDSDAGQTETWSLISGPAHGIAVATYSATSIGGLLTPTGLSYAPFMGYYGPDTFIVRVTDGRASDTTTICVNVLLPPHVGAIAGDSEVCIGASIVLTDTPLGGAWASSSGIASVVGGTVTGISAGTVTIDYFVSNMCGSVFAAKTITVDTFPSSGTILGGAEVCIGDSITLTNSTPRGTWRASTGATAVWGMGGVSGMTLGVDTIIYTVANGCGSISVTHPIVVLPMPDAGSISGADTLCPGATAAYTSTVVGGVWSSSNTTIASLSGGGVLTALLSGADTIYYTLSNSACSATALLPVYIRNASACDAGVDDVKSKTEWSHIYPNPTTGDFSLFVSSPSHTAVTIIISNAVGKKILERKANSNELIKMKIAAPAGVYFVSVYAEVTVINLKLIVEQ